MYEEDVYAEEDAADSETMLKVLGLKCCHVAPLKCGGRGGKRGGILITTEYMTDV